MKQLVCILVFMVIFGCSDSFDNYLKITYNNQDTIYIDSISFFGFSETEVDTFVKSVEYIYLESKQDSYLERISKLVLTKDHIFVGQFYENSGIFIFDKNGALVTSISDFGKGPAEVSHITDFIIDEKNQLIFIGEGGNRRISIFQFDGVFKRAVNVD